MDFIKNLGYLAIASRLKRLTERFMRGGREVYQTLDVDFEPRWFPVFNLLYSLKKPLAVTEISDALNISHPAVIQTLHMLEKKQLVKSQTDSADRRKRRIVLTEKGQRLAEDLRPVWNDFETAVRQLFKEAEPDILHIVERIETELDREEIGSRIMKNIRKRWYDEVKIVDFSPQYKKDFKRLNHDWLSKYFRVEEQDERMLSHPETEILEKGGSVFFARLKGRIIGTASILKIDDSTFEIAKMAVEESFRGRQAGRKLACEAIKRARDLGADKVVLKTDPRLEEAVGLYRSMGFRESNSAACSGTSYEREESGLLMELDLT